MPSCKILKDIESTISQYFPFGKVVFIPKNRKLIDHLMINGVYILYSKNKIVYIGMSGKIGIRLLSHLFNVSEYNSSYKNGITKIAIIRLPDNFNPMSVECRLIEYFKPYYNKANVYLGNFNLPDGFNIENLIAEIEMTSNLESS